MCPDKHEARAGNTEEKRQRLEGCRPKSRNAAGPQKLDEARKTSPLEPLENHGPANTRLELPASRTRGEYISVV